ncbi:MAG: ATP-grasp domain-containing protein [Myxococcaceae bacterium]|nr:ATP-grasp domain-containing protein [Myxococcaceae bacterium]
MSASRIGILGGGQLGLMLAESLLHLSAEVTLLDPDPGSPAAARLANTHARAWDDPVALQALFARCDAVTFDSENVPAAPLSRPEWSQKLRPSLSVLATTQDRAKEKAFLAAHGLPVVRSQAVPSGGDVREAARTVGFPCIAKSALLGYDGKGQHRVDSEADLAQLPQTAPGGFVVEERLSLRTELSVIVARDARGEEVTFPVFENLHRDHVLDFTLVPARVSPELEAEARALALRTARALQVVGLLTVELFVGHGRDGKERLWVNELAPRPHNSGHVTRQCCTVSQFDALARILCGAPVGQPQVHPGAWCMGNLLGDVWRAQGRTGGGLDLSAWARFPEVVDVFLYGKAEAREKRKMGHFVVRAESPEKALATARDFRAALAAPPTS